MKQPATRFKSLEVALKEIEPFVKDGAHLQTGRPFKQLQDMRSREVLANWLLCATIQAVDKRDMVFYSDRDSDGLIQDAATGQTWRTEHVFVPRRSANDSSDAQSLIIKAIEQKRAKGDAAYASGKTLVVFVNTDTGEWYPNKVARELPNPLHFDAVWVISLQKVEDCAYTYGVALLDVTDGKDTPTYHVCISPDFNAWDVTALQ